MAIKGGSDCKTFCCHMENVVDLEVYNQVPLSILSECCRSWYGLKACRLVCRTSWTLQDRFVAFMDRTSRCSLG